MSCLGNIPDFAVHLASRFLNFEIEWNSIEYIVDRQAWRSENRSYKKIFWLFTFAFCRVHIFDFKENKEASDHLDWSISKEWTLKNKSARAIWKIPRPLSG